MSQQRGGEAGLNAHVNKIDRREAGAGEQKSRRLRFTHITKRRGRLAAAITCICRQLRLVLRSGNGPLEAQSRVGWRGGDERRAEVHSQWAARHFEHQRRDGGVAKAAAGAASGLPAGGGEDRDDSLCDVSPQR